MIKYARKGPTYVVAKITKSFVGVTHVETDNLLENFKTDILSSLSSQFDTLRVKKK
jgi:hypothetical protein